MEEAFAETEPARSAAATGHSTRATVAVPRRAVSRIKSSSENHFNNKQLDGVRGGPWKLRLNNGRGLFRLDPSERHNRAKEHPEIAAELTGRMQAMAAECPQATKKW